MRNTAILFSMLLASATAISADDNVRGEFYVKDQVKSFFAFHTQFQQYSKQSIDDINAVAFGLPWGYTIIDTSVTPIDTVFVPDTRRLNYNQFAANIISMGFEFGASYHQFTTSIDATFMPAQVSKVPAAFASSSPNLYDVKWFRYGFDWMFGYMLAPEQSRINVIPSVGAGFSLLNMHFASNYDLSYQNPADNEMKNYSLSNRYYSTFGKDVVGQVEVRMNLGAGFSLGVFGGTRFTWFDKIIVETSGTTEYFIDYGEISGDSWYLGGKLIYTLPSVAEDREKDKL